MAADDQADDRLPRLQAELEVLKQRLELTSRDRTAESFTTWPMIMGKGGSIVPLGMFANCASKEQMMERLITQPPGFLKPFVLVARDWRIVPGQDQYGRGDILLANGDNSAFVVLQVQHLSSASGKTAKTKRTMKRAKCRDSALRYGRIWKQSHANATVHALTVTNEAIEYLGVVDLQA